MVYELCILTFYSLYDVLKTEKILKAQNIQAKTVPVPRSISSDCGIGLEFNCQNEQRIREILTAKSAEIEGWTLEKLQHE